ncbi:hypothetical protein HAZT_HAZT000731 [Hyalella azteca]|uniref:LNS2/PITP domain-containing protein n=1 Tax=Hyalella azteca TaxID=294128 RepID=A0A6A0HEE4_HYAAZ|nr:hypothetical protein HAZT_HAZT000731 [Hyalella azteca]
MMLVHHSCRWCACNVSLVQVNVTSNHRGNDVLVRCGAPQTINARFMYGPLDMVALSGEKVDMHIMRSPPNGEWCHVGSPITDKTGRLSHTLTHEHELPAGIYPVKMTVRGDHTGCTLWLAVVPVGTHVVVFSIDGALTASVSVSGADPKVRPGAVDVLRVWQQRGYLLLYITGRPDLQHHKVCPDLQHYKVLSWLAKHNFPHGLLSFVDGITTDPLGHKASYLRSLVQDHGAIIDAAYGSTKDIGVYSGLGLAPEQIYVVGKANKKQHTQAQCHHSWHSRAPSAAPWPSTVPASRGTGDAPAHCSLLLTPPPAHTSSCSPLLLLTPPPAHPSSCSPLLLLTPLSHPSLGAIL